MNLASDNINRRDCVKDRQVWIDLLRIGSAYAVVLIHTAGILLGTAPMGSLDWWLGNIVDSGVHWAVPVFIMISGYLLLNPNRTESAKVFYSRRVSRILVPMFFWSGIYIAHKLVYGANLCDIVESILRGGPGSYHLWFLSALCGLYLFTPMLRDYFRSASPSEATALTLFCLLLSSAHHFLSHFYFHNQPTAITLFIPYLGYYMTGYLVHTRLSPVSATFLSVSIIGSTGLVAACNYLLIRDMGIQKGLYMIDALSPPMMAMSIGVTLLARRWTEWNASERLRSHVRLAGRAAFGVYLVHPLIVSLFGTAGVTCGSFPAILSIPCVSILVFALSLFLTVVLMRIPLLRIVVGAVD